LATFEYPLTTDDCRGERGLGSTGAWGAQAPVENLGKL